MQSAGNMAERQSLSGRRQLLVPSGRSSAESRTGHLRKRHTVLETLEISLKIESSPRPPPHLFWRADLCDLPALVWAIKTYKGPKHLFNIH